MSLSRREPPQCGVEAAGRVPVDTADEERPARRIRHAEASPEKLSIVVDLDRVERFAILVVSEDAGATVLEAPPPQR